MEEVKDNEQAKMATTTGKYILLTSAKDDRESSRSFNMYDTASDMSKALADYYESYLTDLRILQTNDNGATKDLEYSSDEMFKWMDEFFGECNCLKIQSEGSQLFVPYAYEWVKEQLMLYFIEEMPKPDPDIEIIDNVAMDVV